ncbi:hypothetical protein HAHE_12700 [Haloferula helveola]|uniref:Cytochrome c domain-containing protein n=1 Tax=Haloferula helveola TaxID=490095 RepID=A0ABN6H433_9BACT|nr:hypothetical protein HAHE_12700 [Haloferula helveola]
MRPQLASSLFLSILTFAGAAAAKEIFNGKNLDGWDGDSRLWRVENGVLIGETDKADRKIGANTFLIWKGEVGDFTLTYKARAEGNNSGVQYRSKKVGDDGWVLGGYQMDLHPKDIYLGMLYEEKGRGIACTRGQKVTLSAGQKPKVTGKLPVPAADLAKWNEFKIVAEGNVLKHFVNGELAAEITDTDEQKRSMSGLLGLQLHAGPPMKVEFKDIDLSETKAKGKGKGKPSKPTGHGAMNGITVPEGFVVEKLFDVAKDQGSWVAITEDDKGRLICSDQYGGLYRVTLEGGPKVEPMNLKIGGSHGILWHRGALYVSVNEQVGGESGVYRITDSDGDGEVETISQILKLEGRGEHGPHALVPSPDGEWIYFSAGNHTNPPQIDPGFVPPVWGEDHLLTRRPDARGHARGRMAPGGWIARVRPDGTDWQLVSIGYRNQYDIAFNEEGDLFAYDADMEWDLGMPWYRPTRICHVVPGSEFGWRNGTGKWPAYFEDSMPPVVNIGPGSPTGFVSGKGAKFPAKYQKALYAFDWTFATVHAIHLEKDGAGYTGETDEFLSGNGLPLTDAVVGSDGAMYFMTGGRKTASALWKVSYVGDEDTSPVAYADQLPATVSLKGGTSGGVTADMEKVMAGLSSDNRTARYVARTTLERDYQAGLEGALNSGKPWPVIEGAIGLARTQGEAKKNAILQGLGKLDWSAMNNAQKLAWLRAMSLACIRGGGELNDAQRKFLIAKIDSSFPSTDDVLNRELCRVLSYLNAPGVVGRTLALMDAAGPEPAPDWADLASRNGRYGPTIKKMIENQPPSQVIHYIYCLRAVPGPWSLDERRRFFAWIERLKKMSGGASYGGFLNGLRDDAVAGATPEEQKAINDLPPPSHSDPFANLPPVKGPGRTWSVEEVVSVTEGNLEGRDPAKGKAMFQAGMCAACHRFGGEGGAAGPDLSLLAGRFGVKELAEAILDPSKEVSDQYHFEAFTRENGTQVIGRQVDEKDEKMIIAVNPFDFSQTEEVSRSELVSRKASPVSPMPAGLINSMNEDEVKDLFAYLLGK